jgi:hypothetical protein
MPIAINCQSNGFGDTYDYYHRVIYIDPGGGHRDDTQRSDSLGATVTPYRADTPRPSNSPPGRGRRSSDGPTPDVAHDIGAPATVGSDRDAATRLIAGGTRRKQLAGGRGGKATHCPRPAAQGVPRLPASARDQLAGLGS